tara:strand:+ start:69 stop:290 length:222 start_codon:yes stop_codon:yes gene_type:complete
VSEERLAAAALGEQTVLRHRLERGKAALEGLRAVGPGAGRATLLEDEAPGARVLVAEVERRAGLMRVKGEGEG